MKKGKIEKGITLIALIITIVVLLILAVVAIGAVQNDGIINYAKNARDEYRNARTNEATILQNYIDTIEESEENETKVTFYIATFEDYYNQQYQQYQTENGITWKKWFEETKYGLAEGVVVGEGIIECTATFSPAYLGTKGETEPDQDRGEGTHMVSPNEEIIDRCVLLLDSVLNCSSLAMVVMR